VSAPAASALAASNAVVFLDRQIALKDPMFASYRCIADSYLTHKPLRAPRGAARDA
jgi:hypothetical protein